MTDQELQQLAREYTELHPPQTVDEGLKQYGMFLNATEVFEPFLRWLLRNHLVVEKEKVISDYADAKATRDLYMSAACINAIESQAIDHSNGRLYELNTLFGTELFEERSEG